MGARCRFTGANSFVGLCSSFRPLNMFAASGVDKISSIPHGLRSGVAIALARSDGGMAAYLLGVGSSTTDLVALGNIGSTLSGVGAVSFGNLAGGINISSTIAGSGSISNAPPLAFGNIACSISIGARPSAFDIAQAVWEELLTGHTTSNTAAKILKDKLSRNDYIGLS